MSTEQAPPVNVALEFKLSAPNGIDSERQLVFGWASVVVEKDGTAVIDAHGHLIEPIELEDAVYQFVRCGGMMGGVEHEYMYAGVIIESMVFTAEKMTALGIPAGTLPQGWWIGMYIYDKELFDMIKNGTFKMFSIAGKALDSEKID